jgi:hypothetical protein
MTTDITREELIALCERGRVPQEKWSNRDSASAQRQLGEAWALLSAGCEFEILSSGDLRSDKSRWWIEIKYEGFKYHESYSPYEDDREDFLSKDTAYIPTSACLDAANGEDWYSL